MLVVSKISQNIRYLERIGFIDWLFIIDFDENSEYDGLFSRCRQKLEERKKVHLVVKKNDSPIIHVC
jgi:hypothetical protein